MQLSEACNPVILFGNALGDCVMALPTIRALAKLRPHGLHLVLPRGAPRVLFDDLPLRAVDEIAMHATPTARTFDVDELLAVAGRMDFLIAPNPWFSHSVAALLARVKPRRSIGFFATFTDALPLDFGKHSLDLTFDVVRHLDRGARPEDHAEPIRVPPAATALVAHNETKPAKRLPAETFARCLRRFTESRPDWLVLVLARAQFDTDVVCASPGVLPVTGLPLLSAIALIAAADLFLGPDSFPLHVADFHRVPGIGLFGPTSPEEFGFRFSPRGCHLRAGESMSSLTEEMIVPHLSTLADLIAPGDGGAL
jgi:hypothetical protein